MMSLERLPVGSILKVSNLLEPAWPRAPGVLDYQLSHVSLAVPVLEIAGINRTIPCLFWLCLCFECKVLTGNFFATLWRI